MTNEQLREKLLTKLNSPTWVSLKNSFVGKELIEYAVQVIQLKAYVAETVRQSIYPDMADVNGLLLQAFNLDLPVNIDAPASVKVFLTQEGTYRPYSLRMVSGSATYYNTQYVKGLSEVTLYQGNLNSALQDITSWAQVNATVNLFYDKEDKLHYIKLGEDAIAESVLVFINTTYTHLMNLYHPLVHEGSQENYKLKRNYDKSLNVYFGDGKFGQPYDSNKQYQVIWLSRTQSPFIEDQANLYEGNQELEFQLISFSDAVVGDISFLRKAVKAAIAENAVVGTEPQIKAFVKSKPGIIDCKLHYNAENPNQVIIYVKPSRVDNYSFSQIEDELDLKGEFVTSCKVLPGEPLRVTILLDSALLNTNQKYVVAQHLKERFSYENLAYFADLSPSKINDIAQEISGVSITSALQVTIAVTIAGTKLVTPTAIYRNTLKVYQGSQLIAWDSDRLIISRTEEVQVNSGFPIPFGDFFLCSETPVIFNEKDCCAVDMEPLQIIRFIETANEVMVETMQSILIFDINDYFKDTELSLLMNPYTRIEPKLQTPAVNLENAIYVEGKALYKAVLYQGRHHLWKYDLGVLLYKAPNFDVALAVPGWVLISVGTLGDDMILFFREGIRLVQDFAGIPQYARDVVITGTGIQQRLATLVQVVVGSYLVLLRQYKEGDKYYTVVERAMGPIVSGTSILKMTLRSQLEELFKFEDDSLKEYRIIKADNFKIIVSDGANLYQHKSGILSNIYTVGSTLGKVQRVGTVAYGIGTLQFDEPFSADLNLLYSTSEKLDNLKDYQYPVIEDVAWQE